MIQRVNREQPFQVLASNFSIGPSNSGYDLEISADGVNYTTLFSVGANVTRMVTGVANGSYYRLGGNTDDDVAINWRTQCNDGQGGGGGGAGSQGPQGTAGAQGYQGPSNSGYKISLSTHAYENYTENDIAAVNAFLAAVSADSATLNGAYVVVGGQDVFYLSHYDSEYALFGDTNNGFIHSISWNFDPETAEITGGEYVVNTIPEGGGNEPAFGLKAVETLGTNWDNPEAGDVQAHFSAYTETQETSGTFDDGLDTGGMLPTHIICNEDIDGTTFTYDGGTWEIGWDGTGITLTLVDGDDNITGVYTIVEKGDASDDGYDFSLTDGDGGTHFNIFIEKNFEINNYYSIDGTDTAFADYFAIPTGITGEYTGYTEESRSIADGVWQYDGTDWIKLGVVHLDVLSGTGNESIVYEYNGKLFTWSDEGGVVAEWSDDIATLGSNKGYGLIFSHIPDGQTLFEVKYTYDNESEYKVFKMSGDTLVMCNTGGTVLSACTLGESKEMRIRSNNSSTYWVKAKVEKNWIGFEMGGGNNFRNIWNGQVTGGHFCITDHSNYPYMSVATETGIARWNNKGQIVAKEDTISSKDLYFNNTGTSSTYKLNVLTRGTNNGPSHLFVPSQSGTQGQVLVSAGNAEPTWATLIKSVQITSDAYDALVQAGTTDPNTLYLIVNE